MAYEQVSETFQPINGGGYTDAGDYYSPASAAVTNSIFLSEADFEAFDTAAITAFVATLTGGLSSITLTSTLNNTDALQDQAIGVAPLYYSSSFFQATVLSDQTNDASNADGAFNYDDVQDESGAVVGPVTNLELAGGLTATSVNVISIEQAAAAADRDLIVAYVNNASNYGLTTVVGASIKVTGLVAYDLPTITGTQSGQDVPVNRSAELLSTVSVTDPGNVGGAGDTAALEIESFGDNAGILGTLSFENGYTPHGTLQVVDGGDYELAGESSIGNLQDDLRHIAFTPTVASFGVGDYGFSGSIDLEVQSASGGETNDDSTTFTVTGPVACFVGGTMIATPDGGRPVETLVAGESVLTDANKAMPVVWLGHRRVADALLVRFAVGSLGSVTPTRDLVVSNDHGIFVDGVIVPAGLLVNDATITFERRDVTLFHVELERHAILLAEGATAESYLDTGNRARFANCRLGYDPVQAACNDPCAEVVFGGPHLARIRAGLEPVPA